MVKVDLSGTSAFFDPAELDFAAAAAAHRTLSEKSGAGSEFTGWLELPQRIRDGELKAILAAAQRIRGRSKALVVIGIGGSYLGARGAIELLRPVPAEDDPEIFFVGNGLSPDALSDTVARLGDMDFDINVISKSGTTLEPALAFRVFRKMLKEKYGSAAKKHIFATTDAHRGALKALADAEGWECFVVPDDVGGRYSVLSAVGLLPMAVAGIDIKAVISSAIIAFKELDLRSAGKSGMAVRRGASVPVRSRPQHRNTRLLRAVVPLHGRMVEAALRRERGQKRHRHLPRLR